MHATLTSRMSRQDEKTRRDAELLQGTLDMLILKVAALRPIHGYAIVQRPGGGVVRSASTVSPGERLTVRFAEDQLTVTADEGTKA